MTPQELCERVRDARDEFTAVWQDLSEAHITQRPGPQPDRSVLDLVAHVAWWEKYAMGRVATLLRGGADMQTPDFDAVNAQVFEQHRDIPFGVVLDEYNTALIHIEEQIGVLSKEQLNAVGRYPTRAQSLLNIYLGNTINHYADHQADLEMFVASLA